MINSCSTDSRIVRKPQISISVRCMGSFDKSVAYGIITITGILMKNLQFRSEAFQIDKKPCQIVIPGPLLFIETVRQRCKVSIVSVVG